MSELLNKISSYNIFNYLLPGVIFCLLVTETTSRTLIQQDIIVAPFFYYFVGLIISRVGSIVIEPLFTKTKIIEREPYEDYLRAREKDPSIEILSEQNNMYRTIAATFLCMLIFYGVNAIMKWTPLTEPEKHIIYSVLLLIIFSYSYRKQTSYIVRRIKKYKEEE